MSASYIGIARKMARSIIRQVVQDEAFASQLRADPRTALLDAGLPEWAVDDYITKDLGLESDVVEYSLDQCAVTSLPGWNDGDGLQGN